MTNTNRSLLLLDCVTGGESRLTVETGIGTAAAGMTIVERKGLGHPDTLADHLAEALSRAYARHTLEAVGAILHHNFDKLALLGGSSRVSYGGGSMGEPVRVLVNGRATRSCGDVRVPVDEIVTRTVQEFFAERLPHLGSHYVVELNITSNSSPGAVYGEAGTPERTSWFTPASVDQLRERKVVLANDTSMGTAWAPLNDVESFVIALANDLSGPGEFTKTRPWCGSDVKVMAFAADDRCDVVFCVPQISAFVHSRDDYSSNCAEVIQYAEDLAARMLSQRKVTLRLNARDVVDRDELYLTLTGSSIESGDEGVVGRGNRASGMITPLRPMNLEGVNGKNPVYHVGKVYNIAARRIADALHYRFGGYAEVHLISATGQALASPWQAVVRMANKDADHREVQQEVTAILAQFRQLTEDLVAGRELTA
jgi:S-adenosylmethionine synthetase